MKDLPADLSKTEIRRLEQYRDRWSSYDASTGLLELSDKLSAEELSRYEIFAPYDAKFLERIAPDVSVATWKSGTVLFEQGSYLDIAFFVVSGEVEIYLAGIGGDPGAPRPIFDLSRTVIETAPPSVEEMPGPDQTVLMRRAARQGASEITLLASMDFDLPRGAATRLGAGELFGEIGALTGWPQSVTARTASECVVVQIRVPALRLMRRKSKDLKRRLDEIYRKRALASQLRGTPLFHGVSDLFLEAVKESVELVSLDGDEVLVKEGEPVDALYLVRSGFLKLLQQFGEGEIAASYLSKGMTLGEAELLIDEIDTWQVTAVSVESSELVKIPRQVFRRLLQEYPDLEEQLWKSAADRVREVGHTRRNVLFSDFLQVALDDGLVQGSSILAIDLASCTRCDDCVRACADTHGGRPRFVREGNKHQNLLIAKSCYHCRDPVCLVGCPTGAIHRAGLGEVVAVDEEICIGCST
ncbi:MAG: cyclic nucleotide-binding domain-containing protein, partial [Thermoanaerobaculia bacterium]|nr:cyclic nucleotide-binding domain-containing protein [Thermoanaerobaculia bacterium]